MQPQLVRVVWSLVRNGIAGAMLIFSVAFASCAKMEIPTCETLPVFAAQTRKETLPAFATSIKIACQYTNHSRSETWLNERSDSTSLEPNITPCNVCEWTPPLTASMGIHPYGLHGILKLPTASRDTDTALAKHENISSLRIQKKFESPHDHMFPIFRAGGKA